MKKKSSKKKKKPAQPYGNNKKPRGKNKPKSTWRLLDENYWHDSEVLGDSN